jgi:hypothetical protein
MSDVSSRTAPSSERSRSIPWTPLIAGIGLLLSLLGLLFGPNLVDRLSGPDVIVQESVAAIPWPPGSQEKVRQIAVARQGGVLMSGLAQDAATKARSARPKATSSDWDRLAKDFGKVAGGLSVKEASDVLSTALMSVLWGTALAAMERIVDPRTMSVPTQVMTLKVINRGGRAATGVRLLLTRARAIYYYSTEGIPPVTVDPPPGRGVGTKGRLEVSIQHLPVGNDNSITVTLWRSPSDDAERDELPKVAVLYDQGRGYGAVVRGVAGPSRVENLQIWLRALAGSLGGLLFLFLGIRLGWYVHRLWPSTR